MHIGTRLKKLREDRNVSQKEVSLGIVSTSHYSNIESGRFEPSSEVLYLLAKRLNVPTTYFQRIHEDDSKLQKWLNAYEQILGGSEESVHAFLKKHTANFSYIPSFKQEIMFNLLKYLELAKFGHISKAQTHYSSAIKNISKEYLANISKPLLEKYTYITGLFNYFAREYQTSIVYFKNSLHFTEDEIICAKINYNIALSLYHVYDYGKALVYAKQALRLYMDLHNWNKCGDCYNLIAALYLEQYKMEEAKKYISKGISILTSEKSETHANLYHNFAFALLKEGEDIQALENINRCLEVKKSIKCTNLFPAMKLKAEILLQLGDLQTMHNSLPRLKESVNSDLLYQAQFYYLEAMLYHSMREYIQYEQKMKQCTNGFLENKDWKNLKIAAHHFSQYFAGLKKYKNAYTYQELCIQAYQRMTMESKGGE